MPIRRVYTNWLELVDNPPEVPTEIEIVLDGTHLVVERRVDGQAPARTESRYVDHERAREAFEIEVKQLVSRRGSSSPRAGEDATLAWVVPASVEWRRCDERACETTEEDAVPFPVETNADADVVVDWQLEHDNPRVRARGELATLERAGEALFERARKLLATYADAWVSGLLPVAEIGFRRGFVDTVLLNPTGTRSLAGTTTGEDMAAFLALPIAAHIRRLVIGPVGSAGVTNNDYEPDVQAVLDAVCAHGAPTLRELELVCGDASSLAGVKNLPALERLTLRDYIDFDHIESDTLRELRIFDGHVCAFDVRCPRLEILELRAPTSFYDEEIDAIDGASDTPSIPARRLVMIIDGDYRETVAHIARRFPALEDLEILTDDVPQVRTLVAELAPRIPRTVISEMRR